ncbi:unnamed protein product [Allacma fusca]|uniref:Uncharacterized protein n=1 Tax=Allacma fusca TaxID=39272 RepID=A0A8J2LHI9_9HEXA|nr:unnamed protein product [Allacma fusca]
MVTFFVLASSASKLYILDRIVAIEAEEGCTQFTPCGGQDTGSDQFLSLNMTNCSQSEVQINDGEPLTYTIAFYQSKVLRTLAIVYLRFALENHD